MDQGTENGKGPAPQGVQGERIAIILAPDDQGLLTLFGLPAVRRLILLIGKLGVKEIHLIGRVNALQPILSDLVPPERLHRAEDPVSLGQVVRKLALPENQRVLVLKANHVIDWVSLNRLAEAGNNSGLYFLEALGKGGGKEKVCLTAPSHLFPILLKLWSPASNPQPLVGAQPVQGGEGLPSILDGGVEQARIVERRLMKAQADQTKGVDGFLARHVNRRVSRFISRGLVLTPVTPNQITLMGASIGMAGAFLLSWAGYWPKLIGSLLFLFCIIVDGVDGEIARLKLQATSFGHYLDIFTDNMVHVAIFAGISVGLYHDSGDPRYFWVLGFLLGGFGLCAIAVYQCILKRSPDELQHSARMTRLMTLMSNRDFAYIVVVLALVQRLQWFLLGAAAGTYLFAGVLWLISFYERKRPAA